MAGIKIGNEFYDYVKTLTKWLVDTYGMPSTVKETMDNIGISFGFKYISLNMHYLEGMDADDVSATMTLRAMANYYEFKSLTNNFEYEISMPTNDNIERTFKQGSDTFGMSENQPIDATENITTPYIKFKGKNQNNYTDTTKHNTVGEALDRQKLLEGSYFTYYNFVKNFCDIVVEEIVKAY